MTPWAWSTWIGSDYAAAVTNLQKAIDESKANPEAVLYLRLSVAQDKLQQYPQALDSANKAVQYCKPAARRRTLAKQQQERLQKLINAGPPASKTGAAAAPAATAPPSAAPPATTPSVPPNPSPVPTTPH